MLTLVIPSSSRSHTNESYSNLLSGSLMLSRSLEGKFYGSSLLWKSYTSSLLSRVLVVLRLSSYNSFFEFILCGILVVLHTVPSLGTFLITASQNEAKFPISTSCNGKLLLSPFFFMVFTYVIHASCFSLAQLLLGYGT